MKRYCVIRKYFRKAECVFLFLYCLAILTGCAQDQTQFVQTTDAETEASEAASAGILQETGENGPQVKIYVHVCGAVLHAGVYSFDRETRVFEAIEAAGGFTEDAAQESINQARIVSDGEELYVPTQEELLSSADGSPAIWADTADKEQKVNINTADVQELTTLTGIGETRAQAIIAWREENGGFSSPEELKNIDGIADKTYEKIKDRITVN